MSKPHYGIWWTKLDNKHALREGAPKYLVNMYDHMLTQKRVQSTGSGGNAYAGLRRLVC